MTQHASRFSFIQLKERTRPLERLTSLVTTVLARSLFIYHYRGDHSRFTSVSLSTKCFFILIIGALRLLVLQRCLGLIKLIFSVGLSRDTELFVLFWLFFVLELSVIFLLRLVVADRYLDAENGKSWFLFYLFNFCRFYFNSKIKVKWFGLRTSFFYHLLFNFIQKLIFCTFCITFFLLFIIRISSLSYQKIVNIQSKNFTILHQHSLHVWNVTNIQSYT